MTRAIFTGNESVIEKNIATGRIGYGVRHDHGRNAHRPATRRRAPQGGHRRHCRHHDRVVRLLHLRHRRRPDLPGAVLPEAGPADRHAGCLRHVFRGLRRPPDRCRHLRPLRRPDRPKGDADRHPAADGRLHLPGRLRARLRLHRRLGRGHPDHPSHAARHRGGRGMGRLGADRDGMGAQPRQSGPRRLLAAVRRALGPVPLQPGHPGVQRLGGSWISRLGAGGSRSRSASC